MPSSLAPAEDLVEPLTTPPNMSPCREARLLYLVEGDTVLSFDLVKDGVIHL